jgi:hemin uptake protein HemP
MSDLPTKQQGGQDAMVPRSQAGSASRAKPVPRSIDSHELLGDARQIEILHRGQAYCLRITSLGKLILTK